jgi:hypothetical protein
MDLEQAMADRTRRHMLTSIAGVILGIVLTFVGGAAVRVLFGQSPPAWTSSIPALGILSIPAIGFWSTYRNLRCPACERVVAWQVSAKYSALGAMASNQCRHCGATIFGATIQRRFRRMFVIMFAVGIGIGLLGAGLSAMNAASHRGAATTVQP